METEYQEKKSPIDEIESTHYELIKAHDFSNEDIYSVQLLRELAEKWEAETLNPIRSERSKKLCGLIAKMCTFEIAYRNGNVQTMSAFYKGKNL